MYLYYDENGSLQEVINDRQSIQGDTNLVIYCYFKGLDLASNAFNLTLQRPDGTTNVSTKEGVVTNNVTIPYSKTRDLRYFKYYTKYSMVAFTFDSENDLTQVGVYAGCPQASTLSNLQFYNPLTLNVLSNNIVDGESYITASEYAYVLSKTAIGTYANGLNGSLTSTVLTFNLTAPIGTLSVVDVDLSPLKYGTGIRLEYQSGSLKTSLKLSDGTYTFSTTQLPFNNYVLTTTLDSTLDSFYTKTETDTLLNGYLPLSGGTLSGNITLGENSITCGSIATANSAVINGSWVGLGHKTQLTTSLLYANANFVYIGCGSATDNYNYASTITIGHSGGSLTYNAGVSTFNGTSSTINTPTINFSSSSNSYFANLPKHGASGGTTYPFVAEDTFRSAFLAKISDSDLVSVLGNTKINNATNADYAESAPIDIIVTPSTTNGDLIHYSIGNNYANLTLTNCLHSHNTDNAPIAISVATDTTNGDTATISSGSNSATLQLKNCAHANEALHATNADTALSSTTAGLFVNLSQTETNKAFDLTQAFDQNVIYYSGLVEASLETQSTNTTSLKFMGQEIDTLVSDGSTSVSKYYMLRIEVSKTNLLYGSTTTTEWYCKATKIDKTASHTETLLYQDILTSAPTNLFEVSRSGLDLTIIKTSACVCGGVSISSAS